MKIRLNITIEENLVNSAKRYAAKNKAALSQLIESDLKSLSRPARRKNIIEMVDKLSRPKIDLKKDLKQAYHEELMII